jgi:hypothetical protein
MAARQMGQVVSRAPHAMHAQRCLHGTKITALGAAPVRSSAAHGDAPAAVHRRVTTRCVAAERDWPLLLLLAAIPVERWQELPLPQSDSSPSGGLRRHLCGTCRSAWHALQCSRRRGSAHLGVGSLLSDGSNRWCCSACTNACCALRCSQRRGNAFLEALVFLFALLSVAFKTVILWRFE